jgi:hypothetical protein
VTQPQPKPEEKVKAIKWEFVLPLSLIRTYPVCFLANTKVSLNKKKKKERKKK